MLHLTYLLFISSFFLLLMLSVAGGRRLILVRGSVRVEDSHIKKLDSQKLNAILCKPCSYYRSASVTKWSQKQSQSI